MKSQTEQGGAGAQGQFKQGDMIRYNDGRPGHDVQAVVLAANARGMTVSFEDRADITRIQYDDREWMDFICAL